MSSSTSLSLDEFEGKSEAREEEMSVIKDDEEEDDDEFEWSSKIWEEIMRDDEAGEEEEEEQEEQEEQEEEEEEAEEEEEDDDCDDEDSEEEENEDEEEDVDEENLIAIPITSVGDVPDLEEEIKTLKFLIASINSRSSQLASDFQVYYEAKEQESVLQRLLTMFMSIKLDALEARNQRLEAIIFDHQRSIELLMNMRSEVRSLQRKVNKLPRSNDVHGQQDQQEVEDAGES